MGDRVVQSRIHRERDEFVASISDESVLRLASSHHGHDPCAFFQPAVRGSYNMCYFVQFGSTPAADGQTAQSDRWVVRVPLRPCLARGARAKLESEVATMRLLSQRTTIPVPAVHAYSVEETPDPLSTYMILEHVRGEKPTFHQVLRCTAEQQRNLYTSLADIFIQLRRLEFPAIGCLTEGPDGFAVTKMTTTIDLNMQEQEGLRPTEIQESFYERAGGVLQSANAYFAMLSRIIDNAFLGSRDTVLKDDSGEKKLYRQHTFRKYAEKWLDPDLDRGPFVLVHGDLELYNLLVDQDMRIVAVLDWEWSRVVPLQYFTPPLWMQFPFYRLAASCYAAFELKCERLLKVMRARERERYGNELLADEWNRMKLDGSFLAAMAMENWTATDPFADGYIDDKFYGGNEDLEQRVRSFVEEDPTRAHIVARKVSDGVAYMADVARLEQDEKCPSPAI